MPLPDDFLLTPVNIDFVNGAKTMQRLSMDPDDVRARGIDATFSALGSVIDMTGDSVSLWWQHDQAPALRGLEPFEPADPALGRWKVHYPSAMGQSAGTVTAKIVVTGEDLNADVKLPTIWVDGPEVDPSATPNEDTFSVLGELLLEYKSGVPEIRETIEEARSAATDARDAASEVEGAVEGANAAAGSASDAAARANAAAERAETGEDSREAAETRRAEDFEAAQGERTEEFEASERSRTEAFGKSEQSRSEAFEESERDRQSDYEAAEALRVEAERSRAEAEALRVGAEASREVAEAGRAESQSANDVAQARNNADQDANNKAAQGLVWVELTEGQLDPETRVPAIDGEFGKLYFAPSENPTETDAAVEWMWKPSGTGEPRWEHVGSSEVIPPSPIGTDAIQRIHDGEQLSGKGVMSESDLSFYQSLLAADHKSHEAAQKATDDAQDAAIAEAKRAADDAGASLAGHIEDQDARDSGQDDEIAAAKARADEAYDHVPDIVTSKSAGTLPAFPAEGGPLYPTVDDGGPVSWQAVPIFDATRDGLVPKAPEGDVKVLLSTGWGDYRGGGMPDYRPLKKSIATATAAKEAANVRGTQDFDFGTMVTTQADVDALARAIEAAQSVLDAVEDPDTSQSKLDDAKSALDAALSAYQATVVPLAPDKGGLEEQEGRYAGLKAGVSQSADGKDVAFGGKWVTASEQSAADSALSAARSTVEAATKQSQIDSAVSTLKSAVDTYGKAVKTATKDTSGLDAAVSAANAAKQDVQTSDQEGSDLPSGSQYVTTAEMSAFNAAIQAATTAKTASTTQAQLDAATATLTAATATFQGQVKTNWAPPENIASASWEDIERLSALAAESPQDYQKYLGQTKTIDMSGLGNGCTNVTAMVIGVGHDVDPQGHKLGLTFQLRDGLPYQTFTMNSSNTTSGGWRDCLMRSTNLPKVKAAMPADLRSRLKTMVKKTHLTNAFNALVETQDDLALLSQVEVWGEKDPNGWTLPTGEGTQYEWYAAHNTNNDRIIKRADGSAYYWWLRSVYDTTFFRYVFSDGTLNNIVASYQYLPCACFSV